MQAGKWETRGGAPQRRLTGESPAGKRRVSPGETCPLFTDRRNSRVPHIAGAGGGLGQVEVPAPAVAITYVHTYCISLSISRKTWMGSQVDGW